MEKYPEQMMEELFSTYYEQCSTEKIKYAIYNPQKSQGHIVLDNSIEIIHFTNYQGQYAIKFAFARVNEEFFFDNYQEALHYWNVSIEEFDNYMQSITL